MNALNLAPQERDEIARRISAGCAACCSMTLIILIRSSIRDRPLKLFYSISDLLLPKIDFKSIHPLVGTKANRLHLLSCFAYVVLPDPDKPQTMMSVGLLWHLPVIWSAFRAEAPSVSSALVTMEG